MSTEPNCNYWGTVDFGEGPVRVRCTQVHPHQMHKVEVYIQSPRQEEQLPDIAEHADPHRKNIFERPGNGS